MSQLSYDQRLVAAAMDYVDGATTSIEDYVVTREVDLQTDLLGLLRDVVVLGEIDEPMVLTAEDQAMIDLVAARRPWKAMVHDRLKQM